MTDIDKCHALCLTLFSKKTIIPVMNDEHVNILKQYEVNTKPVTLKSHHLLLHVNYGQKNIQFPGW